MAEVLGVDARLVCQVARWFHEAYEQMASLREYETRPESAVPWEQVPLNNRALMLDTAAVVLSRLKEQGLLIDAAVIDGTES
jgi:hypothetical protein